MRLIHPPRERAASFAKGAPGSLVPPRLFYMTCSLRDGKCEWSPSKYALSQVLIGQRLPVLAWGRKPSASIEVGALSAPVRFSQPQRLTTFIPTALRFYTQYPYSEHVSFALNDTRAALRSVQHRARWPGFRTRPYVFDTWLELLQSNTDLWLGPQHACSELQIRSKELARWSQSGRGQTEY